MTVFIRSEFFIKSFIHMRGIPRLFSFSTPFVDYIRFPRNPLGILSEESLVVIEDHDNQDSVVGSCNKFFRGNTRRVIN